MFKFGDGEAGRRRPEGSLAWRLLSRLVRGCTSSQPRRDIHWPRAAIGQCGDFSKTVLHRMPHPVTNDGEYPALSDRTK